MTDLLGYDGGYKERDDVYYALGGSCVWEGCVRHEMWYIMEVAVPATDGKWVHGSKEDYVQAVLTVLTVRSCDTIHTGVGRDGYNGLAGGAMECCYDISERRVGYVGDKPACASWHVKQLLNL